jgi:hypothetical protein
MLSFNDFKKTFLNWSDTLIEPKQDSGSPICPYARKARLQNKIQFIDARENSLCLLILIYCTLLVQEAVGTL